MSTDNKTLADVQPGGRVRLGDGLAIESRARELLAEEYTRDGLHLVAADLRSGRLNAELGWVRDAERAVRAIEAALSAQTSPGGQDHRMLELARRNIRAYIQIASFPTEADRSAAGLCVDVLEEALSAQPSPGGQGDWRAMLSQFGEDDPREGSRSNGHDGVDHNDWVDHAEVPVDVLARIATALAARQPSKQPDSVALGEATEFCIEKGDRQPVGHKAVVTSHWRDGRLNHILYCSPMPDGVHRLYAAPPGQAADLSQFRDALVWAEDAADCSSHPDHKAYRFAFTELLGMIDSKAERNG